MLFRFTFTSGALSDQIYWATPGSGVEPGETFQQTALRELKEETGLIIDSVGDEIAQRKFKLQMPDGEFVMADERFFVVHTFDQTVCNAKWTDHEKQVMTAHHWWSKEELAQSSETIFPENIQELLSTL